MKKITQIHKCILLTIFILIIGFPYINSLTHIIKGTSLYGVTIAKEKPIYSIKTYLSGEFQTKYESWYLENYPYRNNFIKTYNQARYDLFKEGNEVVGKDNYLFSNEQMLEYFGVNVDVSKEKVEKTVDNLKRINEICKENSKELYLIITPKKEYFYEEYIPDRYFQIGAKTKDNISYYDLLSKELEQSDIRYLDSYKWLSNNKIEEPLFYKTGFHWSYMSSSYTLSEFIKMINDTSNIDLPELEVTGSEQCSEPYYAADQDFYDLLNIKNGVKDPVYYKPILKFENTNAPDKNLFMQGGSFCWNLIEYLKGNIFQNIDFSFYQQYITKYNENGEELAVEPIQNNKMSDEQMKNLLSNKDVIILEVNQEYIDSWVDEEYGFPSFFRDYLERNGFNN